MIRLPFVIARRRRRRGNPVPPRKTSLDRRATVSLAMTMMAPLLSATVDAQAYQCTIPTAPQSVPRIEQDGPTRQMPVNGYTLALSWSLEFCRNRTSNPRLPEAGVLVFGQPPAP